MFIEGPHGVGIAHLDADDLPLRGLGQGEGRDGGNADVEALHPRRDLGEFRDGQFVALRQNNRAEHGVFELADIARPGVAAQQRKRFSSEAAQALALFGRKARHETAGEIGNVLPARA